MRFTIRICRFAVALLVAHAAQTCEIVPVVRQVRRDRPRHNVVHLLGHGTTVDAPRRRPQVDASHPTPLGVRACADLGLLDLSALECSGEPSVMLEPHRIGPSNALSRAALASCAYALSLHHWSSVCMTNQPSFERLDMMIHGPPRASLWACCTHSLMR